MLDMFKRFLDEATENDSFSINRTEPADLLQKDSDNAIYTLKVGYSCQFALFIYVDNLPTLVSGGRSAHVLHWLPRYHLQHCLCCLLCQAEITKNFSQVIMSRQRISITTLNLEIK